MTGTGVTGVGEGVVVGTDDDCFSIVIESFCFSLSSSFFLSFSTFFNSSIRREICSRSRFLLPSPPTVAAFSVVL